VRVLIKNKEGQKRALKAHLFDKRWLAIRPRDSSSWCFDLKPQEVQDFEAGKTIFEDALQEGRWPWTIQLIK
jgi:hypothetical protein